MPVKQGSKLARGSFSLHHCHITLMQGLQTGLPPLQAILQGWACNLSVGRAASLNQPGAYVRTYTPHHSLWQSSHKASCRVPSAASKAVIYMSCLWCCPFCPVQVTRLELLDVSQNRPNDALLQVRAQLQGPRAPLSAQSCSALLSTVLLVGQHALFPPTSISLHS